jgi:hypothetical protein
MVATTRHRKLETAPLRRPGSPAAEPAARARGSASHSQTPASASGILKSQTKSSSSSAATVAAKKGSSSARGRSRASTAPSASDEDDNNQGIFPTKKRQVPSSVVSAGNGSDSDDAPEEVTRSAAQQLHEQTTAAMRMASQPDLVAKRAEKDRLRAVTQAAQEAASRRKAADAAALEELPQDVLNAAAAATLTLQQSLAAPRTNHIAFLPEISKKPTSRFFIFAHSLLFFFTLSSGWSTAFTCRTCRCLSSILCQPPIYHTDALMLRVRAFPTS